MTRADVVGWMADLIGADRDAVAFDPWDAAARAFRQVVGREPTDRWGAVTPSPGADVEDALVCWDLDLMAEAAALADYPLDDKW